MEKFEIEIRLKKMVDKRKREIDHEQRLGRKCGEAEQWLSWRVAELEGELRRTIVGEDYDGRGRRRHINNGGDCRDCMITMVEQLLAYARKLLEEEREKRLFGENN